MRIIGVTGPSGAGKGAVSEYMRNAHGFKVIDADLVYHDIISVPSECVSELVDNFGRDILNEDGGIDRKTLSKLVFGDENKDKLLLLNKITHKYVMVEIEKRIELYRSEGADVTVIDAPLLIEAGMHTLCDEFWVVYTSPEVQIQRAMARDGATLEQVQERIKNQSSIEEKKKLADRLISNDGTIQELYAAIDKILKDIVKENNDG